VNLTPHPINLIGADGQKREIPASGQQARCSSTRQVVGELDLEGMKVPITQVQLGAVSGLPGPEKDTMYIVSLIVASAVAGTGRRDDIVVPDDAVREADGRIVGCRALARQP
jgi:hypothetical protein